ncbi:uncharacterized protein LOC128929020 isoform X2 [Callithrix jacchus]
MRCSCLFIILGAGWGLRGHGGGRRPGSPRPSLPLPRRGSRPGWVGGALASWAAARISLAAGSLLPRSRLRPRPPGHSSLQVGFRALPRLPGPRRPPAGPPPLSVRRPRAVHRWRPAPPPRPAPVAGSSKESIFLKITQQASDPARTSPRLPAHSATCSQCRPDPSPPRPVTRLRSRDLCHPPEKRDHPSQSQRLGCSPEAETWRRHSWK